MRSLKRIVLAGLFLAAFHSVASAAALGVEVWTDRGDDGIYEPGQAIQVKVRASEDSYLLVYGIDTEGDVSVLFPTRPGRSFVQGRSTYRIPPEDSRYDLVVDDKIGQGFLVAIASRQPFRALPWYLRPLDARGEDLGYTNYDENDANDGVTEEGRIVGDPYVAMERIRRQVLEATANEDDFTSAYTSYYVHQPVRYPRYVCYDCHRPGQWAWWDGFDPYYTTCSVVDFRVNWSWAWGPTCWTGFVPYTTTWCVRTARRAIATGTTAAGAGPRGTAGPAGTVYGVSISAATSRRRRAATTHRPRPESPGTPRAPRTPRRPDS